MRWSLRTTPHLSTDDSGDDEDGTPSPADKSELHGTIKSLSLKLDDLSTCNELVAKHGVALQRSLNELDGLRIPAESSEKLKAVNERATLFRITSNAMINVSAWAHGRGHLLPRGWSGLPLPAVRLLHVTPSTPLGPGQVAGPHCQVEPGAGHGARRALQAWAQEAVLSGAVSSVPTAGMRLPHCPNTAAAHPPFSSAQPRRGVSGTPDQGGLVHVGGAWHWGGIPRPAELPS